MFHQTIQLIRLQPHKKGNSSMSSNTVQDLVRHFQKVTIVQDEMGKDILKIHTFPKAGKFRNDYEKIPFILVSVCIAVYIFIGELQLHTKFPNLELADGIIVSIGLLLFFAVLFVLYTDNHYEISQDQIKVKSLSFNRFVFQSCIVDLKDCKHLRVQFETVSKKNSDYCLTTVCHNNSEISLEQGFDFEAGLAFLDLVQHFLKIEEKVEIGKYHYELYLKQLDSSETNG